jgi:putative ABC transport system substrate-binding protein
MKRRPLVVAAACAGAMAPVTRMHAQIAKPKLVAWLAMTDPDTDGAQVEQLKDRLRALGWVEGRNIAYDIRWARGERARLPGLARELVSLAPDVVYTGYTDAALAARGATQTIPIVVWGTADPVGTGLAQSLARPGGNVTGVVNVNPEIGKKWIELLREAAPKITRVAVLWKPSNQGSGLVVNGLRAAAHALNVALVSMEVQTATEIDRAFVRMFVEQVDAVIVTGDSLFLLQGRQVDELLARHRLPSVVPGRDFVLGAGGLISYLQSPDEVMARSASQVDRILRGAKPADLPFEQATRFELFISRRVAKALGLKLPQSLLLRATEVIE